MDAPYRKCGRNRRQLGPVCVLLAIVWLFALLPVPAYAAEPETLKVGYVLEGQYNYLDANGDDRGFDPEYAEKLAQYGRYLVEFAAYSRIDEAIGALKNGDIDMLMDFSKTPEREKIFSFSELPLNKQSMILYADADAQYTYGDYSQLDGMKIGALSGSDYLAAIQKVAEEHQVTPVFSTYADAEALQTALVSGEIDAAISGTYTPEGFQTVLNFNPSESYIMFRMEDNALKSRVDAAMAALNTDQPSYAQELFSLHTSAGSAGIETLTEDERGYLLTHSNVKVAVVKDAAPFVSLSDGKITGIIPDYYASLEELTGLTFYFVPYDSTDDAKKAVLQGEADVLGFSYEDEMMDAGEGLSATNPYTTLSCARITRRDFSGTVETAAVTERTIGYLRTQMALGDQSLEMRSYSNVTQCYNAVMDGDADSAICSMISVTWLLNQHGSRRTKLSSLPNVSLTLCGAVRAGNFTLLDILNKAISGSEPEIERIITENTAADGGNIQTMIENMPVRWIIVFTAVLLVLSIGLAVTLLALIQRQREKETLLAVKAENERRDILLTAAEKTNDDRNQFFSNISHDMRTPLNAIIGFANLAREEELPPRASDYLAKIQTSGKILLELINDTLTVSKINSGKLELHLTPVDTRATIEETAIPIRAAAEKKNITLSIVMPQRFRTVLADSLNTQKIFLNLLSNAVKYTPSGGHVTVAMRLDPELGQDPDTFFTVKDDGIGMSQEFLPHVYDPFTQENRHPDQIGGTGLGLSIVKQLVDLMGGSISVSSEIGKGTTFTLRLHFEEVEKAEASAEIMPPAMAREPGALAGRKILLCEDNALNREIACALLAEKNIAVVTAENGQIGVRCFAESAPWEFSLILMDLRMPIMDGYQATGAIRALDREDAKTIPILAMTADAFADDVQKCLESGMNGHISKPIDPETMFFTMGSFFTDSN